MGHEFGSHVISSQAICAWTVEPQLGLYTLKTAAVAASERRRQGQTRQTQVAKHHGGLWQGSQEASESDEEEQGAEDDQGAAFVCFPGSGAV